MMAKPSVSHNTPILAGVGQITVPVPDSIESARSHADIAGEAARIAMNDALPGGDLASCIDTVAAVRTFADTMPIWRSPFGGPDNFPCSIASRLGFVPDHAVYEVVGGQSPQKLVGECCEALFSGKAEVVLIAGGEAIANMRAAMHRKAALDWNESVDGPLDDRGINHDRPLFTSLEYKHNLSLPMHYYGLMENARRKELKQTAAEYILNMGILFAKLSKVAASNPHAAFPKAFDAKTLITPTEKNPMLVSPYTKHLIAKDNVNQGAALILTTVGKAKSLGIPEAKWIYLHGYADCHDRTLLERNKLGRSKAMELALKGALEAAHIVIDRVSHFDLYSCFPIVVSNACDILGINMEDPRLLTTTGGLPFFGGPGNNYSMHGIVSLVEKLRTDPGNFGLIYANGGWMSKHSAGIYSTEPLARGWAPCSSKNLQALVDNDFRPGIEYQPRGKAEIESFIINYDKGTPANATIIGCLDTTKKRFMAVVDAKDLDVLEHMQTSDPLGKSIYVTANSDGNRFVFKPGDL